MRIVLKKWIERAKRSRRKGRNGAGLCHLLQMWWCQPLHLLKVSKLPLHPPGSTSFHLCAGFSAECYLFCRVCPHVRWLSRSRLGQSASTHVMMMLPHLQSADLLIQRLNCRLRPRRKKQSKVRKCLYMFESHTSFPVCTIENCNKSVSSTDVAGEQSSTSSTEDTSTSTDGRPSDLLYAILGSEATGGESSTSISTDGSSSYGPSDLETSGVYTSSSAEDSSSSLEDHPSDLETSGVFTFSSSEDIEKIDLLAELQATAVLEDAAGDQVTSDADLDYILGVIASMRVQSAGLSRAEILQLIQGSPRPEQMEVEQQISDRETEDEVQSDDVVATARPTKIKHLGFPNLGNTCYMNSVLQCLLTVSPFRDDVLSQRERWNDGSTMLRALSDLHMTRLTGNDKNLKAKLLFSVKRCIETLHPDFLGDHQQDAHEFLMVCLARLKEEGELLQSSWPQYTCPVANMEFLLKRRRTCDSCGFQSSFTEESNYLSLVIGPQGCLVDSLQQYFKTSSFECSCSECAGREASEALELISLPRYDTSSCRITKHNNSKFITSESESLHRVLVLLVMRFDITSSMRKMKNRLHVPEDFALSCDKESREMRVIPRKSLKQQQERTKTDRVETAGQQVEASDGRSAAQYSLAGVVSHLGSSLYCGKSFFCIFCRLVHSFGVTLQLLCRVGHYISHIRDFSGSGWLRCSDTRIRRSSWSKASRNIGKNGYVLFYVKSSAGAG
ncbi:uncharacterized protein LOC113055396 isoform X2 [Carassius auratus]|uniref:Uncharacterized protein LOC113055396 isoform X2 n=1 Tax=Carassius auratus TaxID=7957 RepID=A0A6P6L1U1_CARAU|nr:uncharacterized protein LOC113055396 isoform X2 [Carassius auratus]